jgi:hypothetical protein
MCRGWGFSGDKRTEIQKSKTFQNLKCAVRVSYSLLKRMKDKIASNPEGEDSWNEVVI